MSKADYFIVRNRYGYCKYDVIKGVCFIFDLYIKPEYRKEGHATNILKEIKSQSRCKRFFIQAVPYEDNIPKDVLVRFYNKMGIVVLSDELTMEEQVFHDR